MSLDYSKYNMKTRYPDGYPKKPRKPILSPLGNSQDARRYADELEVYEQALEVYKVEQARYREIEAGLLQEFRADALKAIGWTDRPDASLLFEKAWQDGHSSGYEEVFSHLEDLAYFVDQILALHIVKPNRMAG